MKGRGGAARSQLVDAWREAVGVRARPLSRGFSKRLEGRWSQERGGAKGGAPHYKPRTRVGTRSLFWSWSWLRISSSSLALPLRSSALAVVEAESFIVLVLCSRLGERPVHGGTDGGRGSAGGVVDLRVWARSAGEGSQTARGVGARRDHADGRGREDSTVPKGSHYFLFGFLYGCCGAVSCKVELCK